MNVLFFPSSAVFRTWLERYHGKKKELWVGLYKKVSKKKGIHYQEALDEALCFGWIDGLTKSIDKDAYMIRFTPRRPKSNWSQTNIKRVEELQKLGRMHAAGQKAFAAWNTLKQ